MWKCKLDLFTQLTYVSFDQFNTCNAAKDEVCLPTTSYEVVNGSNTREKHTFRKISLFN